MTIAPVRIAATLLTMLGAAALYLGAATAAAPPPSAIPLPSAPAEADDVATTERSVVRVVTVAIVNGEVVGFGHGSGFAISPNRIVTNAHVVGDAAEFPDNVVIGIVPSEGSKSYPGRLIRLDTRRDLAIVEIVSGRIPAASIYTGPVAQRERVFALGYPGNVDVATAQNMDDFIRPRTPLASDGIVSATDAINGVAALIHDADIARGNSGGPLVDACGRVIGVNTFISRADDGDSPFSFAVTVRELATFLQESGQRFTGVASECLTQAELAARSAAADAQTSAAAAAEAQRREAAEAARTQELDRLRGDAQNRRETFMALAYALFGIAILAGAASFLYQSQNKPRERRSAILAGSLLAVAAILLFLLRPDPADVRLPPAASDTADPPAATAAVGTGNLACIVDRNRGRINFSAAEDTSFALSDSGCVNNRTQYVRAANGLWSRTLVPEQDATVSRVTYDPASGDYITRNYRLSLDAMTAARRQRASVNFQGCTADPERLATLAARENAIAALLPPNPSEEIVSKCRVEQSAAQ